MSAWQCGNDCQSHSVSVTKSMSRTVPGTSFFRLVSLFDCYNHIEVASRVLLPLTAASGSLRSMRLQLACSRLLRWLRDNHLGDQLGPASWS
jgi:hypothetical protein